MVERVPWMAPVDYEIMLFFEDHPILVSPRVLAANIEYDRQYVSKRCRALADANLLEIIDTGLYQLTDTGKEYLKGELDVSDLERNK
ncbi:MarR family transcriptional regulator [Natrinema longum]|uniref:MarR family transcriptional regulator n=1 Tax=Natrinema longum TaxID=370324 RepID=A0A8A2UAJ7_9EURY|nr:MarR family transcriptional regulator [Natrinema longum]MBZ6496461.1 MarR family transcriptional regulator [Natrinema longum]QSW85633.1 MarR family transcriptional regulator [Natrinema longum]